MKRTLLYLTLMASLIGCVKDLTPAEETQQEGKPVRFEIRVTETKALESDWTDGDQIYVFFKGLESKYLILTYEENGWTNAPGNGSFLDTDFAALGDNALTAVYFPVAVDVAFADGEFSFAKNGKPFYNYYLLQKGASYTVNETTVTAALTLSKPEDFVLLSIPGIGSSVADYTLGSPQIIPEACVAVGLDGSIIVEELQAGARLSGIADGDNAVFGGQLAFSNHRVHYTFSLASDDWIYTLKREAHVLEAGHMYIFPELDPTDPEFAGNLGWTKTDVSSLYVDLGLSVMWAKCNLGAETEEDYGDYFAWGELQPKSKYNWETYYWMLIEKPDYYSINKYTWADGKTAAIWYNGDTFIGDGKISLDLDDDAAYAALGGRFRMPTAEEWIEIIKLKNREQDGSSLGYRVYNDEKTKSVFFPAAGSYEGDKLDLSGKGDYWASTLKMGTGFENAYSAYAKHLFMESNGLVISDGARYSGYSIRPVYDPTP